MNKLRSIIDRMDQLFLVIVIIVITGFNILMLTIEKATFMTFLLPITMAFLLLYFGVKYIKSEKSFVLILGLAAFIFRAIYALAVHVPPISDFELMLSAAKMINNGDLSYNQWQYFNDWAYQLGFVGYQALILRLFGSTMAIKLFNCISMAITTILVYAIASKIFDSKTGRIAGILHLCYLPLFYYAPVLTNQHIATMFYYLFVWFLLKEEHLSIKNGIIAGICLALGQVFRPLAIVFVLALILYMVYHIGRKKIKDFIPYGLSIIVYLVLFQLVALMITSTGISEQGLVNKDPYWKFVPGLNQQYYGRYNPIDNDMFLSNPDTELRQGIEKEIIKERLMISPVQMAKFQVFKLGGFWGDYENSIFGLHHLSEKSYSLFYNWYTFEEVFDLLKQMEKVLYTILFVGFLITAFTFIKYNDRVKYLMYVISFYVGVHLFIEVSVRYRYVMMGAIIILAAKGLMVGYKKVNDRRLKHGNA